MRHLTDTLSPQALQALADRVSSDIDKWSQTLDDGDRARLGAARLGHVCDRHIWYGYRWAGTPQSPAHRLRKAKVGKEVKSKVTVYLRAIGAKVWSLSPRGEPFYFSDLDGHFSGTIDAGVTFPEYKFPAPLLLMARPFSKETFSSLSRTGLRRAYPEHYITMSICGKAFDIRYGLYIGVNTNDETMHVEVVPLDLDQYDRSKLRAASIITSPTPPDRCTDSSAYHVCKKCPHAPVCWFDVPLKKSCRTCQFSVPVEGGKWGCNKFQKLIDDKLMKEGCEEWTSIKQ